MKVKTRSTGRFRTCVSGSVHYYGRREHEPAVLGAAFGGEMAFGAALLLLVASVVRLLRDNAISVRALELQLSSVNERGNRAALIRLEHIRE